MLHALLRDNPIYQRELRTSTVARWIVKVLFFALLGMAYLSLPILPLVAGAWTGAAFVVTQFVVLILAMLLAQWTPPALVGGTLAGEAERGTLPGLVLTPFPRRHILFGFIAARVRTLVFCILLLLPFTYTPFLFLGEIEESFRYAESQFGPSFALLPTPDAKDSEPAVLTAVPSPPVSLRRDPAVLFLLAVFPIWLVFFLLLEVLFSSSITVYCSVEMRSTAASVGLAYMLILLLPCVFGLFTSPLMILVSTLFSAGRNTASNTILQQILGGGLGVLFKLGASAGALLLAERRLDRWMHA